VRSHSALGRQKAEGGVTPGHLTTAPAPPSPPHKGSDRPELTCRSSAGRGARPPLPLPLGQPLLSPLPEAPCCGDAPCQPPSPAADSATLPGSTERGGSAGDTHQLAGTLSSAAVLLTPLKLPADARDRHCPHTCTIRSFGQRTPPAEGKRYAKPPYCYTRSVFLTSP